MACRPMTLNDLVKILAKLEEQGDIHKDNMTNVHTVEVARHGEEVQIKIWSD